MIITLPRLTEVLRQIFFSLVQLWLNFAILKGKVNTIEIDVPFFLELVDRQFLSNSNGVPLRKLFYHQFLQNPVYFPGVNDYLMNVPPSSSPGIGTSPIMSPLKL